MSRRVMRVLLVVCLGFSLNGQVSYAGLFSGWKKKSLDTKIEAGRLSLSELMAKYRNKKLSEKHLPNSFVSLQEHITHPRTGAQIEATPLIWLVFYGSDAAYQPLLTWLVNHYLIDLDQAPRGVTALMYAMAEGREDIVQQLLSHGADPNLQDDARQTALMHGMPSPAGNNRALATLIAHEPDPNLQDRQGMTALMHALSLPAGRSRTMKLELLARLPGHNLALRDRRGHSARDYAADADQLEALFGVPEQAVVQPQPVAAPRPLPVRQPTPALNIAAAEEAALQRLAAEDAEKAHAAHTYDCSRIAAGFVVPPPREFADLDVMLSLVQASSRQDVQETLLTARPNLTAKQWQILDQAVQKRRWGRLVPVLNPTHLELARNPADFLANYHDPVGLNIERVGLALFDQINWHDRKKPGALTEGDRYEDGETFTASELRDHFKRYLGYSPANHQKRDAKRLRVALCRLHNMGPLQYRSGMTDAERQSVDADAQKRNLILVEMARAGRHCFSRHSDTLSQSLQLLLSDEEASLASGADFRFQLIRSLKNKRRDLIETVLNQAPDNERAHAHAYWMQLLGQHLGLPEYPPMENFNFVTYVGPNADLSAKDALAQLLQFYSAETMIEHLQTSVGLAGRAVGPRGAVGSAYASSQDKDYHIDFDSVYTWTKGSGLGMEEVMDDSLTELSLDGAKAILFQIGDFLTMELH